MLTPERSRSRDRTWARSSERALAHFRRDHIGIVFQFFNLLDDLTVRDNILLPTQLRRGHSAAVSARADELLEALSITHRAARLPGPALRR